MLIKLALVLLALLASVSACAAKTTPPASTSISLDPVQIFEVSCAPCHGADRMGLRGPELTPDSLASRDIDWLTSQVNHSGRLTEAQKPIMAEFLQNTPP